MRIVVEGHDLPGSEFVSDGVGLHNVHVAVQIGDEPVGRVRGDADAARWEVDVRGVVDDGGPDLRGPAVHGKKGDRFLYLTWGDVGADGSFDMFRRAKLMVGDVDPEMLAAAIRDDGVLVASLSLTDQCGGSRGSGHQRSVGVGAKASTPLETRTSLFGRSTSTRSSRGGGCVNSPTR